MDQLESSLDSLTEEQIKKAFEKTRDETTLKEGKLVLLKEDRYKETLAFARDFFMTGEPITQSIGLEWCPEVEQFWLAVFQKNMSLLIVNPENDEIMAMRTIRVESCDEIFDATKFSDEKIQKLIGFFNFTTEKCNVYKHYGIKSAVHFFALAVGENYRRKGLGGKIMEIAINFVKNLGIPEYVIKGEGTSNFSKKIYEKEGFDILADVAYDSYKVNDEVVINNTGEHKSTKIYGKRVTDNS